MALFKNKTFMFAIIAWLGPILCSAENPAIFENPLSPRIVDYAIDVRLIPEKRKLDASETMTWRNQTDDVITEIQLHLYLNAFRNNRSTLYEESGGAVRQMEFDTDSGWGYSEVTGIMLASGEDLTEAAEFIQPDNDFKPDKTVMRLPLPYPVNPGDSIVLEIDFIGKLPTPPIRTGAKGEFYFAGQWFPKAGVYIDGAWNCHQFHADAEFFADFGVYDVEITVPEDYIVGATGLEYERRANDDSTMTFYYHAEDVHDFAWAASPEFVEYTCDTQDVAIRILMQPDRVDLADRYIQSAKAAVGYMQDNIGDYPYPNLTVIDPRRGALNAGGMEYPTLFTALGLYGIPDGMRFIEETILHEFAHGYFQHLVASNEFEEAWLDEGLTTYHTGEMMEAIYGSEGNVIDIWGIKINQSTMARTEYMTYADRDPCTLNAWDYYSSRSYVIAAFYKPATMLVTLKNYLGEETMRELIRTYFERWKFKHPRGQDFFDVANEVSGQDLGWFFDQAIGSNAVLDYSVSWISSKEIKPEKGYDFTIDVIDDEKYQSEDDEEMDESGDDENDEDSTMYFSRVKVRRMGTFIFPVEIEIVFDDGEVIRESWDGRDNWTKFSYTRPSKLVSATVDPDRKVVLDVNFTNNSRTLEPEGTGIAKLCVRSLFWAQFMMEQPDFANLFSIIEGFLLE